MEGAGAARAPPVQLRLYAYERRGAGLWAVVEVLDSGPGIPPDVLPLIFDRFYKSDTARTRTEGSGLGLAITTENVRLHHGTVHAANHPGAGPCSPWNCPCRRRS